MRRSEEEYKEAQRRRSLQDEEYNETMEKMIAQTAQEAERYAQVLPYQRWSQPGRRNFQRNGKPVFGHLIDLGGAQGRMFHILIKLELDKTNI